MQTDFQRPRKPSLNAAWLLPATKHRICAVRKREPLQRLGSGQNRDLNAAFARTSRKPRAAIDHMTTYTMYADVITLGTSLSLGANSAG